MLIVIVVHYGLSGIDVEHIAVHFFIFLKKKKKERRDQCFIKQDC
jgi:hypothetical protein